jgi:hypothetical protein
VFKSIKHVLIIPFQTVFILIILHELDMNYQIN